MGEERQMRMRLLLLQRMSGEGKTKMENPSLERAESTEIRLPAGIRKKCIRQVRLSRENDGKMVSFSYHDT